jgi:peptidoglycan/LPS O-acetylase OafA/YrhL
VRTLSPNKLPCLDGLRAIAIGMVIFSHARYTIAWKPPHALDVVWDWVGFLGVQVFFGLSGYLITYLLVKENDRTGTVSLRNFYMRRVLRIFPAFYFYLAVITLLTVLGVLAVQPKPLLASAVYLKNYFNSSPADHSWFVGHSWSLGVEEQFYLFWPVLFVLAGVRRARYAALALILAMPFVRVFSVLCFPEARGTVGATIHTCADRLMFGCLLALLDGNPMFEGVMKRFASSWFPALAAVFLVFMGPHLGQHFHASYTLTLGISLEGGLIAFIIAWLLRHPSSLGAAFLNRRFMVHLGVLSYSLYLWQQLFMTGHNRTFTGWFPLNILFAYGMACASYYLIERRFLEMRSRFRPGAPEGAREPQGVALVRAE